MKMSREIKGSQHDDNAVTSRVSFVQIGKQIN